MTELPSYNADLPKWLGTHSIIPTFSLDFGQNPVADLITDMKTQVNIAGNTIIALNEDKKKAIDKAKDFLQRFNEGKNSVRDNIVGAVTNFGDDLSALGGYFILPTIFYGGMSSIRDTAVRSLSSSFKGAPNFSDSTWASGLMFVLNLGEDFINAAKALISFASLFQGPGQNTTSIVDDVMNNPFLSPLATLLGVGDLKEPPAEGGIGGVISGYQKAIEDSAKYLWGLKDNMASEIADYWDTSIFKDIQKDINNPDPTGNTTAFGTLYNAFKDKANKPLEINDFGLKNPFDALEKRGKEFLTKPYDTWYTLLSLGDLLPGIKDVTKFAAQLVNETSNMLDFGTNGITNGLNFVDALGDVATGFAIEGVQKSNQTLDGLSNQLKTISFDLFMVPPIHGGLEMLRYSFSEWVLAADNVPDYQPGSLTMMGIVVFGAPDNSISGLTNLGKIFNININN